MEDSNVEEKKEVKKGIKKAIVIWLVLFSLAGAAIVGLYMIKKSMDGKFMPGTHIANIDFSKKTPDEAIGTLNNAKEEYMLSTIEIRLDENSVELPMSELGVEILVEDTVEMMKGMSSANKSIFEILDPQKNTKNIELLVKVDEEVLMQKLENQFSIKGLEPIDANFYFEGGVLNIKEELAGETLDTENLVEDFRKNIANLKNKKIELALSESQPAIKKETLEAQKDSILASLQHQVTLVDPIYSDDWYVKLADHLEWVTFVPQGEGETASLAIEIKQESLNAYIDEDISGWLDMAAEPVNIYMDENEEVIMEGKGSDGKKVQRELLKEAMEIAVANKVKEVIIPVKKIRPEITISEDLQALGVTDRVSVGHTSFYGSTANRLHNIKVGSSQFNGKLIAPGEVFSFNTNLGPVDGVNGYRKELVIKADGTKPEYGGGICQVSTTMYRTLLYSGLPIVERHPHSYAVSYYSQVLGHGLDATIYLGGPDLKFENDSETHLLIQTYTQNDYELYIVFYGTPTGETIELEGPFLSNYHNPGPTVYVDSDTLAPGVKKQVEIPHTGFSADWYRHITTEDGETRTEPLNTAYRAIPARILVGKDPVSEQGI